MVRIPEEKRLLTNMKKLLIFTLTSLTALVVNGCTTPSEAAKPPKTVKSASQFVVIDQSEPAFIVFTSIPKNIDKKRFNEIRSKVSKRKELTMLTWQQFVVSVDKYARSVVIRNDYPNINTVDGIVCLVASKRGSGAPWGLTWNSGIALTFMDYQHTRKTYKQYKANPASYRSIQDPRRDPVHPRGHLPFGGCN